MAPTLLIILGLTALAIGLLGTIYPALPGLILMFVGAWLLGYADDYATIGSGTLTCHRHLYRRRHGNRLRSGYARRKIHRRK